MLNLGILVGILSTVALVRWLSNRKPVKFDAHAVKVIGLPDGRLVLKMYTSDGTPREATIGSGSAFVLARDLDTATLGKDGKDAHSGLSGTPWLHTIQGGKGGG